MKQVRLFGKLLRALTSLMVLWQLTCPAIGLAAWPAFDVLPIDGIIVSVSGDGSTIQRLDAAGTTWRRGSETLTYAPSILFWDTAYDGSYYPAEWTAHPSWEAPKEFGGQPWPVNFLPAGLSGDRSTYYGWYFDGDPNFDRNALVHAARYSAESGLDTFGGATTNWLAQSSLPEFAAAGSSADGGVIVGGHPFDGKSYAFRWTPDGGITNLVQGSASNISADGGTIIGFTDSNALFKWTEEGGLVTLGSLVESPTKWAVGGVSSDGSRIVAADLFWSAQTGTRNLDDVLVNWFGLDLAGHTKLLAADISDDGRVIVGEDNLGGFVIELPGVGDANGDDLVDAADYVNWADHFLSTDANWQAGDFNGDGIVDGADYVLWADNSHPFAAANAGPLPNATAVPEPATFLLAAVGILCCYGIRARRADSEYSRAPGVKPGES